VKYLGHIVVVTELQLTPKRKFAFTEQALKAFEDLKTRLTEAPILKSAGFYTRYS